MSPPRPAARAGISRALKEPTDQWRARVQRLRLKHRHKRQLGEDTAGLMADFDDMEPTTVSGKSDDRG